MVITVLAENKACGPTEGAHGLSLHIRTGNRSILFDFGPDGDLLRHNADAMGVDLQDVDLAILSHGHDDHSGGLETFLRCNDHAPVYVHPLAFNPHYSQRAAGLKRISPSPGLLQRCGGRICSVTGTREIDRDLTLFSNVTQVGPIPGSNSTLFEEQNGRLIPDRFLHEQDLLIREGTKLVLVAGCAHRGIVSILHSAMELAGRSPDAVFSGFHLTNPGLGLDEPEELVREAGYALAGFPARYFTGHCTGEGPFRILQGILGDRITYLGCGLRFTL